MAWSEAARKAALEARRRNRITRRSMIYMGPAYPWDDTFTPERRAKLAKQLKMLRRGTSKLSAESAGNVGSSAAFSTAHRNAARAYNIRLSKSKEWKYFPNPFPTAVRKIKGVAAPIKMLKPVVRKPPRSAAESLKRAQKNLKILHGISATTKRRK